MRAELGRDVRGRGTLEARRAGRVRFWVPFFLVAAGSIWALQRLAEPVEAADFTRIDLHRLRLQPTQGGFCDPRWELEFQAKLAGMPAPDSHDPEALAAVAAKLAELPFVAEAGTPRVIWPDGVEVPVRLREPVACVRTGQEFRLVSEDGILLPCNWAETPVVAGRPLPVIGPNDGAFDKRPAGWRLSERRHQDALAVAVSMRRGLPAEDAATLGPLLIDATRSPATSVEEPGTLLELGEQRLVLFGRAPGSGEPGELPDELKWRSLARAAELLRGSEGQPAQDWSVVDLRWDTPAIRPRDPNAPEQPLELPKKSPAAPQKKLVTPPKTSGVR